MDNMEQDVLEQVSKAQLDEAAEDGAVKEQAAEAAPQVFDEKEFLEKVEAAAMKGAKKGTGSGIGKAIMGPLLKILIPALLIVGVMMFVIPKFSLGDTLKSLVEVEKPVEDKDLTLTNKGFLGYKAADFAEAILSDRSYLKKIEVMSYKISDAATLTDAGLAKLKIFSKNQLITYHGTAVYTVDLSGLTEDSFWLNEALKKVYLKIPHAVLEPINIQASDIEYGDVEKGLLAFGSIKLNPEDMSKIQAEAQKKMEQKLTDDSIRDQADRFAKLAVWELYQPIISAVAPEYTLEVTFD